VTRAFVSLVVCGVVAALVGCSPEDGRPTAAERPAPTGSTGDRDRGLGSPKSLPACTALWQPGKTFPTTYEGCRESDGSAVFSGGYDCADGSHVTVYDGVRPALYGVAGEAIRAMTTVEFVDYLVNVCKP
jgi:hypothetical protein